MDNEPWFLLDPNDLTWCRTTEIIDYEKVKMNKNIQDSLAYIIIQDTNLNKNTQSPHTDLIECIKFIKVKSKIKGKDVDPSAPSK